MPKERIARIRVPDHDVWNWIGTLRAGGMSEKQISDMLSALNEEYAKRMGRDVVEEELRALEERLIREYGKYLSEEQKEYMRKGIRERLGR